MSRASREAIADTSFLVDWARYSKRDLLFGVFEVVHIPESVLKEIKLPPAIDWVAQSLAAGRMALFTETQDVENEARRLMALSRDRPLKRIDLPEAICLAAGVKYGYTVLTENGGAYFAPRVLGLGVTVWRAFEVLVEAWRSGLVGDLAGELRRYEEETLHLFRRRDWEYVCRMTRC
ncbi:MAG: DNA-binding protein [Thermoproteus sp.]